MEEAKKRKSVDKNEETTQDEQQPSSSATTTTNNYSTLHRMGRKGVFLRRYEQVVENLLPIVKPQYTKIPQRPRTTQDDWPFSQLPMAARVRGNGEGQLRDGIRAERKEGQLRSMLQCIMAMVTSTTTATTTTSRDRRSDDLSSSSHDNNNKNNKTTMTTRKTLRIVDFCGGTGHLAIPLALLLPHCEVVVVDLKAASLRLVHEKVRKIMSEEEEEATTHKDNDDDDDDDTAANVCYPTGTQVTKHEQVLRKCPGLPNLFTFHGSIVAYEEPFDIGMALHACGEASDLVLRACGRVRANFCVAPCCVGKLNANKRNPYIYHATAGNIPTISYPQSSLLANTMTSQQEDWNELAKAADYTDYNHMRSTRNATRRTAKVLLETDRLLYMKEMYGYKTALCRMDPWECTPKNDILLGWGLRREDDEIMSPYGSCCNNSNNLEPDEECNWDIEIARRHLFTLQTDEAEDGVDWTREEELEIHERIQTFVLATTQDNNNKKKGASTFIFPTGMGRRKRKLIHYVAEKMQLRHWGTGNKDNTKTVVVAAAAYKTQGTQKA